MMDWINKVSDKVIYWELETLLKPLGHVLAEGAKQLAIVFTDSLPEIGALYTIGCAVGLMITGNAPKWLARWAVGIGGAIIWLIA